LWKARNSQDDASQESRYRSVKDVPFGLSLSNPRVVTPFDQIKANGAVEDRLLTSAELRYS